ncbi:hypothetical protein DLH72_03340 [Candidatus Gracilibacteria bacterium]|nr:MAG: hypothetical protein DLH72_03340 [Candidatus Gracilibacteria bacterium]
MKKGKIIFGIFSIFFIIFNIKNSYANNSYIKEPISLTELEKIIDENKASKFLRTDDYKEITGVIFKNGEFTGGVDFLDGEMDELTSKEIVESISNKNDYMLSHHLDFVNKTHKDSDFINSINESKNSELKIIGIKYGAKEKRNINSNSFRSRSRGPVKGNSWEPAYGYSEVNQNGTTQTFQFNDVSGFLEELTYEHEIHICSRDYASYGGYWYSNLPSAYLDNTWFDGDNFLPVVGTSSAKDLKFDKVYNTYVKFNKGTK